LQPGRDAIRLYIAEEQQILREAYQSFFMSRPDIEVVGSSGDTTGDSLVRAALALRPQVMLLGFKLLQPAAVERLEILRESCPDTAIVLLSAYYDVKGIKALREFSRGASVGCAYLLKHTIDTVDQLIQVVLSVAEGRIILDPAVMEGLITSAESRATFLKELTPREMEVLSWMAKGYRNSTIAEVLCLEPKTVERHINSIYSKLGGAPESKHARVHAIMLYLRATGHLPAEDFNED
jgi:DNA-binding NarL/FixJ family response regulator